MILISLCVIPVYMMLVIPIAIASEVAGAWVRLIAIPFFAVFIFLMTSLFLHAPAILVRDEMRVMESFNRTFRLFFSSFGSTCLSTLLAGIVWFAVNMAYLIIAGLIFGICLLLQFFVHEGFDALSIVAGIPLGLIYLVIVLPLSVAAAHLLILYRYENRIRPTEPAQAA